MSVLVRPSVPSDRDAIAALHEAAFGGPDEARLAIALLEDENDVISLVAEDGDIVVGHILFSRLAGLDRALALAPLAVLPARQRGRIGSTIMETGLAEARGKGWGAVFVLGDGRFYERFGFRSDLASSAEVPWAGPHFMALELAPGTLRAPIGPLTYPRAFDGL